ncbi:hypothetical protein F5Y14DRAFT_129058 [Nemania sp. NC0429]|nr:hypothetical protein F5Y14DRAFT_129058 [Nemania sp. NC0429]
MRYPAAGTPPLAACVLGVLSLAEASSILTFADQECRVFSKSITVGDSTGSGDCTMLTPGYSSFMIGNLGVDCAVTIYGHDPTDPICSATYNAIADTICYNSTWAYFSVDNCAPSDTSSSSSTSATSQSTSVTRTTSTSLVTSATQTKSTTSTSSSATTTPEPEPEPEPASDGVDIGAIVGGTISGVFVVAVLVGLALYFFWFRPRQQKQLAELSARPDTSRSRINDPSYTENDAYAEEDHPYPKKAPYLALANEPEIYELSSQCIAEVHEQTHVAHELPP